MSAHWDLARGSAPSTPAQRYGALRRVKHAVDAAVAGLRAGRIASAGRDAVTKRTGRDSGRVAASRRWERPRCGSQATRQVGALSAAATAPCRVQGVDGRVVVHDPLRLGEGRGGTTSSDIRLDSDRAGGAD